jgi:hypothetical protein
MPATRPTTIQQREEIRQLVQVGLSHPAIAQVLGVSIWTARKWVRRTQSGDLRTLVSALGRPAAGPLSTAPPLVRYLALRWKRQHPTWGADYIVHKMHSHSALQHLALPDPATVWRYWRRFGARLFPLRHASEPKPPHTGVVHGLWQLDFKESLEVAGVGPTTFSHARDTVGRATVLHRVHPATQPGQRIVKLTTAQVQADCRHAFTEWGLPDAIQTDRASLFHDDDPTPFPTRLSLWWIGLDIAHPLIPRHTPQCNGSAERSHRTLKERTLMGQRFRDGIHLQAQVDADWDELNTQCPSRARGCDGQPPLRAHPALAVPRRLYVPEQERQLFDLGRVDRYLAQFTWLRTVSSHGQVSLGGHRYGVGHLWARQTVSIRFAPTVREFRFTVLQPNPAPQVPVPAVLTRPARGLSVEDICGIIEPVALPARQLSFPLALFDPFTNARITT